MKVDPQNDGFQGAPIFRCQPLVFQGVLYVFVWYFDTPLVKLCSPDSPGIGSLFLGPHFEFFISVLLLVRRVWLVVFFGMVDLKWTTYHPYLINSVSWDVPQKTEGWVVSKWLVVCFQYIYICIFVAPVYIIFWIGATKSRGPLPVLNGVVTPYK